MSTQQAFKSSQPSFNHKSLMAQEYQNIDEFEDEMDIRIDINARGHLKNPIITQLKREMMDDENNNERIPPILLAREKREKRRQQKLKETILRIMWRKLQLNTSTDDTDTDTSSSGDREQEQK